MFVAGKCAAFPAPFRSTSRKKLSCIVFAACFFLGAGTNWGSGKALQQVDSDAFSLRNGENVNGR